MKVDWNEPAPAGYRRDHRGNLVHEANIKMIDLDMDAVVRKIHGFAESLSGQMWRFRAHSLDDIYAFVARVGERYGATVGGARGNVQLTSFDGRLQVRLTTASVLSVGPEIEAARALIDECVDEWGEGAHANLRALVSQAFKPNAAGELSVTEMLRLRRIEIDDPRWQRAQDAISDAVRPAGKAEYVRIYRRETPVARWEQVSLHLANVQRPDMPVEQAAPESLARRLQSAIRDARLAGMKEGEIWRAMLAAKKGSVEPPATEGAA